MLLLRCLYQAGTPDPLKRSPIRDRVLILRYGDVARPVERAGTPPGLRRGKAPGK